jgi:hypothetical protein
VRRGRGFSQPRTAASSLFGIDDVRFKRIVRPEVLDLSCEVEAGRRSSRQGAGVVGGELAVRGTLTFAVDDRDRGRTGTTSRSPASGATSPSGGHERRLAKHVETSDEWIRERRASASAVAGPDEAMSDVSLPACRRALEMADVDPAVDLMIVATVTPDMAFPPRRRSADELGMPNAAAYDLSAGCTGHVRDRPGYGMVASGLAARARRRRRRLADLDREDRSTLVFGDCAGAWSSASTRAASSASSSAPTAPAAPT